MKRRLSEIHPFFYHLRIKQKRAFRSLADATSRKRFARQFSDEDLTYTVKKHQSLLRRKLGDSDPQLQENKVVNLQIAHKTITGILIKPGETFSFWRCVGEATAKKGYVEGMQLSRGEVRRGVGGGLCQLANLLYWMALHTPLTVSERQHHSFDPFPDDRRTLPFGSGAGVFYNYVDLRFHNSTAQTFQIKLRLTDEHLKGSMLTDTELPHSFHIIERNHRFTRKDDRNYRENEIWRETIDKRTGNRISEEMLVKNFAEVKYQLSCDF